MAEPWHTSNSWYAVWCMLGGWADKKVACGPFLAVLRTHWRARGPPPPPPRRGPPSHSEETPPLGTGKEALTQPRLGGAPVLAWTI